MEAKHGGESNLRHHCTRISHISSNYGPLAQQKGEEKTMTAFDRAWDIAKMPFHGTTLANAKRIMAEDEMKGYPDLARQMRHDWGDVIFASPLPTTASSYAMDRANRSHDEWSDPDDQIPALIHIPDDVPFEEESYSNSPTGSGSMTYRGPLKPSEHGIELVWQGSPGERNARSHWVDEAEAFARQWAKQNRGKDKVSVRRTNRYWNDEYKKNRMKQMLDNWQGGFIG